MAKVAILLGSKSDKEVMQGCADYLTKFGIPFDIKVSMAHRNPEETVYFCKDAEKNGYSLSIAAAGMAAHLTGVAAVHTMLPVIGVPFEGSPLHGLDVFRRADAGRHSGCHSGHRQRGGQERRRACRRNPCAAR